MCKKKKRKEKKKPQIKLRSICRKIARNEAGTSPPQDQTRFPSPVTVGRVVTGLAGLPPTSYDG